jgi:hypothetical protein
MKTTYAKEYGVKLYNQGFLKFGPMEQCDSGEWVRWDDVEPFLEAAELRVETAIEMENKAARSRDRAYAEAESWKDKYFAEYDTNTDLPKKLNAWRIVAILSIIAMLWVQVYSRLGGV